MVDRVIVYPASIPQASDLLQTNRNALIGIGLLAQELFGTSTVASGFACGPTTPTSLNVTLAGGRLYSLQEVDPLAYSTLPADTTDLIVKQGIQLAASTLSCPAPATSGQSINYLIEASFEEVDINAVVLPYYNSVNPSQPFSGPNNSGSANFTDRSDQVQILVKTGTPAATGSQTTPAPDTGFVGLWVVTVSFGQTTITAGNISQYPGAPLLGGSLLQAIQGNAFTYASDVGTANTYAANYLPAVTTLVDGMTLEFQANFANTSGSTFAPNAIAPAPILGGAHLALQGGEIVSGSKCVVMWKANLASWVLLESTGGAAQVAVGAKSNQAVNLGQFLATLGINGYLEIPCVIAGVKNTVIVQWGTVNCPNANTLYPFTFPTPFPNACLAVVATASNGSSTALACSATAPTTTGTEVTVNNTNCNVTVVSIGF